MCGIAGIIKNDLINEQDVERLSAATKELNKRGPDDEGICTFAKAAFGHRRLSIIDTSSAAKQPFTDKSGRYTLVFNGEIYNFKNLRIKLENEGYSFNSQSDTEVLLYAYIHFGTSFLNHLDGFFALAI